MAQHHIQPNLESIQCWDKILIFFFLFMIYKSPLCQEKQLENSQEHTTVSRYVTVCPGYITESWCYLLQSGKSKQTFGMPSPWDTQI